MFRHECVCVCVCERERERERFLTSKLPSKIEEHQQHLWLKMLPHGG